MSGFSRPGTVGGVDNRQQQSASSAAQRVRLTVWVAGRVQGVGFRWWTRSRALELGLTGTAANLDDGRVEVVAEGPRPACEELLTMLTEEPARPAPDGAPHSWYRRPGQVRTVTHSWSEPKGVAGFRER
jgi:acylphosphatase